MDVLLLVGRILFGMIAVGAAVGGHFGATDDMTAYAEARGVKNARPLVLLTGAQLLVAGVLILLGIWPDLGALLFGLFTVLAAFMIHHFWTDTDQMTKTVEMSMFMKNLSITGAAILVFVLFASAGDAIGLQVTGPLFDINLG